MSQTIYGYVRVSSKDQNIERQMKELIAYGVAPQRIYMISSAEKISIGQAIRSLHAARSSREI